MLLHPKVKMLKSKGKKINMSLSALFGRRKEPCDQLTDHPSDIAMSVPPSIIVQGESSDATATSRDTRVAGSDILNDDAGSTTLSTRYCDTPNIEGNCEALDANTNESSGFLNHAHHLVLTNPTMVNKSTNIINQVAGDREVKAKELLSKHIIPGAAHDSSARDPPPQCHPGTRIKINERILAWFYDKKKCELIMWIYGPAGVGKSAIVQTIAEALATAKCLGASVFFSRPNGRSDSRAVFITIAYQLAVHIGAYCAFISEKLASDPELVNKGMKEQFRTFIVEPFVEKQIGALADGKTWGILLDGLDELDEQRCQREIIRLVTTFALEHPDVPLVWVIASRPEPHISNTFKEMQITSSYWEECIPVDSPDACQDVERYLRSSFETIRREYLHITPQDWPEEIKIAKLANAASGLFAFADVTVRFIQDPRHADPATRLDDVLSVIDGSRVDSLDDQPFSHLDALYMLVLAAIPPKMWPVTQRVLGTITTWFPDDLRCMKGLSVLLGLELSKIYTAVKDLYSILDVSLDAYARSLGFYHASFADFLGDVTRSKQFYTPLVDIREDVDECLLGIWLDFRKQSPRGPSSEYKDRWFKYALQFHSDINLPADVLNKFNSSFSEWIHFALLDALLKRRDLALTEPSPHHRDRFLELLCQIDAGAVCQGWESIDDVVTFLFDTWKMYQEGLSDAGIVYEIRLEQLRLDHLEWPKEYPRHTPVRLGREPEKWLEARVQPPWSTDEASKSFEEYISGLKYFQQRNPTLQVLIYGTRGSRFAVFKYEYIEDDFKERPLHVGAFRDPSFDEYKYGGYYCIPYPDDL